MSARWLRGIVLLGLAVPVRMPAAEPELRIALNETTIESFPLFAAAGALSTSGAGPHVRLLPTPSGRVAMAQLAAGEVDAATGSETQTLVNSMSNPGIRIVLTLAECRYRVVARRSAGIQRIADFKGKTVAVTANTSSQYYLARMLERAGLSETDVRLVPLEGPEMPAALRARTVDAVSIWEPHAQNSLAALAGDVVVLEDPAAYTERFNLNTRTDVLGDAAKRAALVTVLENISRVSARIRNQPEEVFPAIAAKFSLPEGTVRAVWPQFTFPAAISDGLSGALVDVESWNARAQKRPARSREQLLALIDGTLAAGTGSRAK